MTNLFAKIRRPSLRQGLMWGLLLGVVEIIYGYITSFFIASAAFQLVLSAIELALFVGFGFLAGRRAAQETGKLGSGAIASIWVGLIGATLAGMIVLVGTLVNLSSIVATNQLYVKAHPDQYVGVKPSDITASSVLTVFLVSLILNIVLCALLSLLGGAVGGMLGRRRKLASESGGVYEEALFQAPVSEETAN